MIPAAIPLDHLFQDTLDRFVHVGSPEMRQRFASLPPVEDMTLSRKSTTASRPVGWNRAVDVCALRKNGAFPIAMELFEPWNRTSRPQREEKERSLLYNNGTRSLVSRPQPPDQAQILGPAASGR
jgi:hypothetical protein